MFEEEDSERKNHDEVQKMPLYKKAIDILDLADKITALVLENDLTSKEEEEEEEEEEPTVELLEHHARYIAENAMIIPAKIAGAEGGILYDLRMENASIIRKAAREIMTDCTGLKMYGFKEVEYLDLLRNEVEEFRVLFAEWVKSFDEWDYIIDRWGLFNPPGVNYDDKDPDDDIPFDPSDFFDID